MNKGIRILIFLALGALFLYFAWYFENENNERLRKTYQVADDISIDTGVVTKIFSKKGVVFVTCNDKEKYRLGHARNYQYKYFNLYGFLEKGDTIYKRKDSDTLNIMRGNTRYYFVWERE